MHGIQIALNILVRVVTAPTSQTKMKSPRFQVMLTKPHKACFPPSLTESGIYPTTTHQVKLVCVAFKKLCSHPHSSLVTAIQTHRSKKCHMLPFLFQVQKLKSFVIASMQYLKNQQTFYLYSFLELLCLKPSFNQKYRCF